MNKRILKKRTIICIEGKAEGVLFSYLKYNLQSSSNSKRKPFILEDMKGFRSIGGFEKKYENLMEKSSHNGWIKAGCPFVFLFDNDLPDSDKIRNFLKKKDHIVIQPTPNVEGMLLGLIGKYVHKDKTKYNRDDIKKSFKNEFGKEAHEMKNLDFERVFGNNLSNLKDQCKKDKSLNKIVGLITKLP